MKIRELVLADALLFAALALALAFVGQLAQNDYFTVAALAFVAATYISYPPPWLEALFNRKNDRHR